MVLECAKRAWNSLEALWNTLHIEHKGYYSLERLQLLRHFEMRSNHVHNVLVIAASTLPTLSLIVLADTIPLAPPTAGVSANFAYWIREYIIMTVFTGAIVSQIHYNAPNIPFSWTRIGIMAVVVAGVHVGIHYGLSIAIGFPVPFGYLVMNMPWITLIVIAMAIHMGPAGRSDPRTREDLKKYGVVVYVASSLAVTYPLFYHLFLLLHDNPTGQFFFTFLLPVIKLLEKFLLNHFSRYMEDLQPALVTCNVEVFNSLFVSCCMQNANSIATNVALMTMDFIGATYALVRLGDLMVSMDELNAKMGVARNQMVHVAAAIIHSNPEILRWRRARISRIGYPNKYAVAGESGKVLDTGGSITAVTAGPPDDAIVREFPKHRIMTIRRGSVGFLPGNIVTPAPDYQSQHNHQYVDDSMPGSPSKDPMLKLSAAVPASSTVSDISTGHASSCREGSIDASVIEKLTHKERKKFVKEALKILRRTEFLLLIEYTELVVPIVYCLYLNTIYRLPNHQYFPYMREMNEDEFKATVSNIGLYGGLQLLSFIMLNAVLVSKFRLPAPAQLAFILQSQGLFIHANCLLWIPYSLQSSLEHVGAFKLQRKRPQVLHRLIS